MLEKKRVVMLLAKDSVKSDARVISEAKSLIDNGHMVTIVAWDRDGHSKRKEEFDRIKIERIGIRVKYSNSKKLLIFLLLFNISAFFKLLKMNFDVVHCHDFDTLIAGLIAGKVKTKKVVYDAHEIYALMIQQHVTKIFVKLLSALEFLLIKRVDALITVSELFAEYFENAMKRNKISVVMNCKNNRDFILAKSEIENFKKRLEVDNYFVILYNGWLIPNNGLEELFNALHGLKKNRIENIVAVICGDGYAEQDFQRIVKEKGIEKYVKFAGKVPSKCIPLFINASNVICLIYNPTDKYNFIRTPLRLFEAIAASKPVIASSFGELGRMIKKENCGVLIENKNSSELEYLLLNLSRNKQLYEELVENSKKSYLSYNWAIMEERLISVYKRLFQQIRSGV